MNTLEKITLIKEHFNNISVEDFERNLEDLGVDKYIKQKCYGHYCNYCRQHNIKPVIYKDFSLEMWDEIRFNKAGE